jgi:hypothetical protein
MFVGEGSESRGLLVLCVVVVWARVAVGEREAKWTVLETRWCLVRAAG